jgi:aminopeptidase N
VDCTRRRWNKRGLPGRIGDGAFFAFLKDYVERESHKIATTRDFFAVLAAHSTVDINDLVNAYFR